MAKTLHSSNSSCAHYRRCFLNIVHNNSGQKNCAEYEDIDKWLVKSGDICFMCFRVAMNAQKVLKFNKRLLFGESWIFEKKKKEEQMSQWSKRWEQIPRFCSKQFKINIWSLYRTMTLINDDLQKKKRKFFFTSMTNYNDEVS